MGLNNLFSDVKEGIQASLSTRKRVLTSLISGLLIFSLMVLASRPNYVLQLLSSGINYFPIAVKDLFLYNSPGLLNKVLTISYAALGGIAVTNIGLKIKFQSSGRKGLLGVLPGFFVTGCASCGVGLLGFLGLAGAITLLPFGGNGVLVLGILLLLFVIAEEGDPEKCEL